MTPTEKETRAVSKVDEQSTGVRRAIDSATRARKWVLGLVLAGVAAAVTGYVTGGITSSVDRVMGIVEDDPPPVGVTVTRSAKRGSGHWAFMGRSLDSVKSLPLPSGNLEDIEVWDAWARQHGGVDADTTAVEVVVEGKTPYPVVLTGISVDAVERIQPTPQGVHVVPFGGGPVGVRFFSVDLDKNPPRVSSIPGEFDDKPAIDFPYRVSQTEPEVFLILGSTLNCDCSWRAKLEWIYQGEHGTTVIDNDGEPFRTVGWAKAVDYSPDFRN